MVTVEGAYRVYEYPTGAGWTVTEGGLKVIDGDGAELGTHAAYDCVYDPDDVTVRERDVLGPRADKASSK